MITLHVFYIQERFLIPSADRYPILGNFRLQRLYSRAVPPVLNRCWRLSKRTVSTSWKGSATNPTTWRTFRAFPNWFKTPISRVFSSWVILRMMIVNKSIMLKQLYVFYVLYKIYFACLILFVFCQQMVCLHFI